MNKKGFTLIELLAVIIIIAIIATISIVAVSQNIDKSRKSKFVNLARTYAESARSMRGEDRLPHDPKDGEAILIKIDALDGVNIDEGKYDSGYGELVRDSSYVVIVNDNHNYKYYVTLLDDTNHGIVDEEYSTLEESVVVFDGDSKLSYVVLVPSLSVGKKVSIQGTDYNVTSVHNNYVVLKK